MERKAVKIVMPKYETARFVNATQVTVSDDSVILQFAFVRPNAESGTLVSEIALSPKHAIEFSKALDATIKQHFTRHLADSEA